MEFFVPRKLKFMAWNKETRLMMRLKTIDCIRGELVKKDHILLQFTGLTDSQGNEVYDMDILLMGRSRYLVQWNENINYWHLKSVSDGSETPFEKKYLLQANRLCSYFESPS